MTNEEEFREWWNSKNIGNIYITWEKDAWLEKDKRDDDKIKAMEAIIVEQEEEIASSKRSCALEIAHSRQLEEKVKILESEIRVLFQRLSYSEVTYSDPPTHPKKE